MTPTQGTSNVPADALARVAQEAGLIRQQLQAVYQGPASVIELLLVALIADGHVLIEGVPGVAKTTLVKAFTEVIGADFKRIQFTPDLLPGDITGSHIADLTRGTFHFRKGPVFANIVLADEINRAPAKTQSALLEAMQEGQVTVEGTSRSLPTPFMVLATQNPIEQEGVYLLPEAQLDRFLLKITMGYPTEKLEVEMLRRHARALPPLTPVVSAERVVALRALAEAVSVSDLIAAYVVRLARATRGHQAVKLGASPRASLALVRAIRAHALLRGRDYANVDDVRALATPVLGHRLGLQMSAVIGGLTAAHVMERVLRDVPYDPA